MVPGGAAEPWGGGQGGTRLMLSRMVANYLMIGVWSEGRQLVAGPGSLHPPCTGVLLLAGLFVAAAKLAEVVQEGEVVRL